MLWRGSYPFRSWHLLVLLLIAALAVLAPQLAHGASDGRTAIEVAKIVPPGEDFEFGSSVAMDGDTVLVGASDAAHVFVRDGEGQWVREASLDAAGGPVALDGDTALVRKHVYVRDATQGWTFRQTLDAVDWGAPVALDGDTAMVWQDVFVRDAAGLWTRQATLLTGHEGDTNIATGNAIALDADRAIVGLTWWNDADYSVFGSGFVFARDATGVWSLVDEFEGSGSPAAESIALEGEVAATYGTLSLPGRDGFAQYKAIVNVFGPATTGEWVERANFPVPDDDPYDSCCPRDRTTRIDLDEGSLVVAEGLSYVHADARAYLFDGEAIDTWVEEDAFRASDAVDEGTGGHWPFLRSIAKSGENVIVGGQGVAYVFVLVPGDDTEAGIDVRPGRDINAVHPRYGLIPVAILTTNAATGDASDFDALQLDPRATVLGRGGSEVLRGARNVQAEDVDGDGDVDLLLRFRARDADILCGDQGIPLYGYTYAGDLVTGSDRIRTVLCGGL